MATPTQIGSAAALLTVVLLGPRVGSTGLVFGAVGSLAAGMLYKSLKSRQQQDGQNSTENSHKADGGVSYPPFEDRSGVNPLSSTGTTAGITAAASSQGAGSTGSKKAKKEKKATPESDEWDFSDEEERAKAQPQKKPSRSKQQPKKEAKPIKPTVTKPTPIPKTMQASSTSSDEDAAAPSKKSNKAKKKSSANASSTASEPVPKQPAIVSEADAEEGWQPVLSRKKRRAAALLHSSGDESAGAHVESVEQNGTSVSSPVVNEKETVTVPPTAESVKVETAVAAAPVEQNPNPATTEATAAKKKKKNKGKSVDENGSSEVVKPASPAAATANGDNSEEWTVVSRRKTRS